MPTPFTYAQNIYHRLVSEKTRNNFYFSAPKPIKHILDRLGHPGEKLPEKKGDPFFETTKKDVYYCYRLLLKREPSAAELDDFYNYVCQYHIDLHRLVHDFMNCEEYVTQQNFLNTPQLIDIGPFQIYLRLNDFSTSTSIATHKTHEPHVAEMIRRLLPAGGSFIDVGANVGFHTLVAAAAVGREGQVYAFEPHPSNVELLEKSVAANDFSQVKLFPYAVGESAGELELFVIGSYSNTRIYNPEFTDGAVGQVEKVPVVALDEFLTDLERVDLIKMDIEGAEPLAWQGMRGLLKKFKPIVLTEFFPTFITQSSQVDPIDFLKMIAADGYEICWINQETLTASPPLSIGQILTVQLESGQSHIDLVAFPVEKQAK